MNEQQKNLSYLAKILNSSQGKEKSQEASKNKLLKPTVIRGQEGTSDQSDHVSFLTIDALAKVNGDIDTTGDVVVDGVFQGAINARNLKVTKRGQVSGVVNVKMAEISGTIEPEIYCDESLVIYETGQVKGKVVCNQVVMHLGAKLIGSIEEFNLAGPKTSSLFKSKAHSQ